MNPVVVSLVLLAGLYVLGRSFQHPPRHGQLLTPSRCEDFLDEYDTDDDEGMDTFAALWDEEFAVDELERLWQLPTREHSA